MTIVMERGDIRAGETIGLSVWIENPTAAALTDVRFRYVGPAFVRLGRVDADKACAVETNGAIPLGDIQPGIVLEVMPLCLHADSTIEERDLNLGFSASYMTVKGGQPASGLLVAEKTLSVGLFGTESVGGVSLRLAAYIVPGLLFMMILRIGGFPWTEKLETTEVATLSVLVSVFLSLIASFLSSTNITAFGIGSGVSSVLFLYLCIAAIAISGLMVLVWHIIKTKEENKRKALLVELTDTDEVAFRKALAGAKGSLLPVTVLTQDRQRFVCALTAPTSSGGLVLVGWFQLRLKAGHPLRDQLQKLIDEDKPSAALALADEHAVTLEPRNPVRTLSPTGALSETGFNVLRLQRKELAEFSGRQIPTLEDERPLMLGTP